MGVESAGANEGFGRLVWEVLETSTGEVRGGQRDLRLIDFEVMVTPPPATPRFDLRGLGPRRVAADLLGWLLQGGRGSTTKRVRLADGFWLVLRERQTPVPTPLVLLMARREGVRLSCVERFELDDDNATATQVGESGSLRIERVANQDGLFEITSIAFVTDVSLRLRSVRGPLDREPIWRLRVRAGSVVRWPRSGDGIRLAPRLRPDRGPGRPP